MKNIMNNKGASLIEVVVGFTIIAITTTSVVSSLNVFTEIIFNSKEKKTKLNDLISAANEFNLNKNNIDLTETFDSINFTLNDEQISLPIRIKTYNIKSQPEKKLITFSRY